VLKSAYRDVVAIDSWRLQRRWRRIQRPLAASLIVVGGLLVWAQQQGPKPTVATVVATVDMPAGHIVGSSDVQVVGWPAEAHPAAAASSPQTLLGRRATAPIRAGEPLTDQRVVGPSVLAGAGPGQVAVALSPDPLTSSGVIRPGDRVNLVGQTETGPRTLVQNASVLTLTEESGTVLAVPGTSAAAVMQAAATDSIAMVLLADDQ
jgi:Flp pilus assembly protein CpaB